MPLVEMHTATQKSAPVLCKLKYLAKRMRQIFKIGKSKQAHQQKYSANNNNNNCESENNNNINSELFNLTELTNEMAQNATNEWLLEHAATLLHTADTAYITDTESHVICLHTEAGQFYWNAALTQATELYSCSEIVWQ